MPDLYGAGANLLEGSVQAAGNIAKQKQASTDSAVQPGEEAGKQLGDLQRQKMAQDAAMKLKQMEMNDTIEVSPQIALGLAKNTGDKGWLQSVGQRMRPDVMLGLYTHGMAVSASKKSPKVTQIYDANGKIRHAVVYQDEEGNVQQLMLDEGITPEALNKGKGGGRGGSKKGDDTFKNKKEFNRAYEKLRAVYDDPMKAKETQVSNPEKYSQDQQWLKDNQDQYDKNVREMGKSGGAPAKASGSSADPGDAPFDADAFIKDALGQ